MTVLNLLLHAKRSFTFRTDKLVQSYMRIYKNKCKLTCLAKGLNKPNTSTTQSLRFAKLFLSSQNLRRVYFFITRKLRMNHRRHHLHWSGVLFLLQIVSQMTPQSHPIFSIKSFLTVCCLLLPYSIRLSIKPYARVHGFLASRINRSDLSNRIAPACGDLSS